MVMFSFVYSKNGRLLRPPTFLQTAVTHGGHSIFNRQVGPQLAMHHTYRYTVPCQEFIDNTGSLLLTTQKLQKVAGDMYFCCGYRKI